MKGFKIALFFISIFSSFISFVYIFFWPPFISPYLNGNKHLAVPLTILPLLGFLISLICTIWLGKSYIFNEINKVAENITDYLMEDTNNQVDQ